MLNGCGVQRGADFAQQAVARCMFVGEYADLDQFVAGEIAVDFVEHGGGETGVADHHDRVQERGHGRATRGAGLK